MIKLTSSLLLGLTMGGMTLSAAGIALTATPTFSQSISASKGAFQCGMIDGKRTTFVDDAKTQEKLKLIHWENENISQEDIDIVTACNKSSETLNTYYNEKLDFQIVVDGNRSDGRTAICLTKFKDGTCKTGQKLFLLKSEAGEKLDTVLPKIIDPNLFNLDPKDLNEPKFRAFGRIYYSTTKPRTFWEKVLGI